MGTEPEKVLAEAPLSYRIATTVVDYEGTVGTFSADDQGVYFTEYLGNGEYGATRLVARPSVAALAPDPGAAGEGLVICPLCHDPERTEDMVGGVCLSCADGIAFSQNARRGAIEVHVNDGSAHDRAMAWSEGHTAGFEEGRNAPDPGAAGEVEGLREAAEAALTDFIYEHGSDFDVTGWPGMAALRAYLERSALRDTAPALDADMVGLDATVAELVMRGFITLPDGHGVTGFRNVFLEAYSRLSQKEPPVTPRPGTQAGRRLVAYSRQGAIPEDVVVETVVAIEHEVIERAVAAVEELGWRGLPIYAIAYAAAIRDVKAALRSLEEEK